MADWSDTAEAYAASFAALTAGAVEPLLDAVDARMPGRGTLLDVGTGPGTLLPSAISRGWRVRGADAEASMVDAARRRFPEVGIDLAALPTLPFAGASVDVATANFVLNHVTAPRAAAAELARVARALVALTVWADGPSPLRPMWDAVLDAVDIVRPPEKSLAPEDDFARTEAGLGQFLEDAGLADVEASTVAWDLVIEPGALWRGVEGGVATIGGIHRKADAETRARLAAAYRDVTAALVDASGRLVVPHRALLGVGAAG